MAVGKVIGFRMADLTIVEEGPDGALVERIATPEEAARWNYRQSVRYRYRNQPLFQHFSPPAPRGRRLRIRAWVTWALSLRHVVHEVIAFVRNWWSFRP